VSSLARLAEAMASQDHVERVLAHHRLLHLDETMRCLLQQQSRPQIRVLQSEAVPLQCLSYFSAFYTLLPVVLLMYFLTNVPLHLQGKKKQLQIIKEIVVKYQFSECIAHLKAS
jgi:hypothetical protein